MAKYEVGDAGYYRLGNRYYAGDEVTLPDDEKPSRTFFPLDDTARAAWKKHFPDRKPERAISLVPSAETPRTMSEMNNKRGG